MTEFNQPSTFFFPLRSNVKYFDSANDQAALIIRVKEAALLYENLLFEEGLYHAVVWNDPEGHGKSYDGWIPPQDLIFGLAPPGVSAAVTGAIGAGEVLRARESWVTAFLRLIYRKQTAVISSTKGENDASD